MRETRSALCAALLALFVAPCPSQAPDSSVPTLKVGDSAPAFAPGEWLKGTPVKSFEKGKVYVVEFWATWCGPCRGVMPELSRLAKEYEGKVTFIGVNIWENAYQRDKAADWMPKVRSFVKQIGDGMAYNVAADGSDGTLGKTWMTAAGQRGIPSTFLVDGSGKIAWIGHPGRLPNQLRVLVDGKLAIETPSREENLRAIADYKALVQAGDHQKALAFVENALDDPRFPHHREMNQLRKYALLSHIDASRARAYGETLLKENAYAPLFLYSLVGAILGDERASQGLPVKELDRPLALKVLNAAYARTIPSDVFVRRDFAAFYFKAGDAAMAAKVQEAVIDQMLHDKAGTEVTDEVLSEVKAELKRYQEARKGS